MPQTSLNFKVKSIIEQAQAKVAKLTGATVTLNLTCNYAHQSDEKNKVVNDVCLILNLPVSDVTSRKRNGQFVWARYILIKVLCEKFPAITLCSLAKLVGLVGVSGKPDHATVIYAKEKFIELEEIDREFKKLWNLVKTELNLTEAEQEYNFIEQNQQLV